MAYSFALFNSSQEVDPREWYSVCDVRTNPFLDLRYIRVIEESTAGECKCWCAVFYDDAKKPFACCCFSQFVVDGALLAPAGVRKVVDAVRTVLPRLLKYRMMVGGLPTTTGHSQGQIAILPGANLEEFAKQFDKAAMQLAKKHRSRLISVKEFSAETADQLAPLMSHGYRRIPSLVTYGMKAEHPSFDEYYQTRSKRTRANMRKVFDKFESAGLRCVNLKGGEGADKLITDDVYKLYEAVYDKAQVKLEKAPIEFFRELARRLPDESKFTFLYQGERVVGFCCAVTSPTCHYMIYCGVDYDLNPVGDVYFNVIYRGFGFGLEQRPEAIKVGAAADEFKKRMGCNGTQLYFYAKFVPKVSSLLFGAIAGLIFPQPGKEAAAEETQGEPADSDAKPASAKPSSAPQANGAHPVPKNHSPKQAAAARKLV